MFKNAAAVTLAEWEQRKAFLGFGQDDIDILIGLRPLADRIVDEIVEQLYEIFIRFPETHRQLRDDATLERLKQAQHKYFLELFDGDYGASYFESRLNIGEVHHRVGLSPEWYLGAYANYSRLIRPYLIEAFAPDINKALAAIDALEKLIVLDESLAITTYISASEEVIEQQTAEILELSTPVVQLWKGVVAATIIGTLDSGRTQHFMERLLERIVETRSPIALIDITGVPTIDSATAQHIIDTISAVRLLGSQVIITGVSPPIAQTLVHLGIDLGGINSRPSLAAGLRVALDMLHLAITPRKVEVSDDI